MTRRCGDPPARLARRHRLIRRVASRASPGTQYSGSPTGETRGFAPARSIRSGHHGSRKSAAFDCSSTKIRGQLARSSACTPRLPSRAEGRSPYKTKPACFGDRSRKLQGLGRIARPGAELVPRLAPYWRNFSSAALLSSGGAVGDRRRFTCMVVDDLLQALQNHRRWPQCLRRSDWHHRQ
jgi:hypothetical protein